VPETQFIHDKRGETTSRLVGEDVTVGAVDEVDDGRVDDGSFTVDGDVAAAVVPEEGIDDITDSEEADDSEKG